MLNPYKFTIFFFAWIVLVTFLSLFNFSGLEELKDMHHRIPHFDKIAHFSVYLVATWLGCLYIRERTKGRIPMRCVFGYVGIAMFVYGVVIELLQSQLTLNRRAEFMDLLANLTGISLGLILLGLTFSSKSRLKWKY